MERIAKIIMAADAWVEENYPESDDLYRDVIRIVARRAFFNGAKMVNDGQLV